MSNTIPTFSCGDEVRIMDTDWIRNVLVEQRYDLANKQGIVRKLIDDSPYSPACHVEIRDVGIFCIPNSCLQKYTPPGVVLGKLRVAITKLAKEEGFDLETSANDHYSNHLAAVVRELWQILNS